MIQISPLRLWAFLLICLGLAMPARAEYYEETQGPAVLRLGGDRLQDGRVEVRLSNFLHVILEVEGPATLQVEKPAVLTQSKFWKVHEASGPEVFDLPDKRVRWRETITLEPLNQGMLPLQIAPLRYRLDAGRSDWQTANWKEATIRVSTSVGRVDPKEARDITGPEAIAEAKSPWTAVLRWSGVALIVLAALLGALEIKRRLAPPKPELAPHEWAAQELDRLERLGLPQHGQAERFHTLVSDTIRRYLELRFRLRAPRQTTAEFLEAMRQAPQLNGDQRGLLRGFLERCDLAKFARAEYSTQECQATADMARTFVEQTKPAPEPQSRPPAIASETR
jgi:hypothetical protein